MDADRLSETAPRERLAESGIMPFLFFLERFPRGYIGSSAVLQAKADDQVRCESR
jgi:hypothetical protein